MKHRNILPQRDLKGRPVSPRSAPARMATSRSGMFRKVTWSWLRRVLAIVILVRFGLNIFYLHGQWDPVPASLIPMFDYQRQASVESEQMINAMEERRRIERQRRTRPPRQSNNWSGTNIKTGPWQVDKDQMTIIAKHDPLTVDHDWSALCEQATLDSTSRVVVSGILSQQPGQALVLLLARQCKVKSIIGVDPLFPNLHKLRLAQMDDYRVLKRAVDELDLIVPSSDPFTEENSTVDKIREFRPTHVIYMATVTQDSQSFMKESIGKLFSIKGSLKSMSQVLQGAVAQKDGRPAFLYVTSVDTVHSPRSLLSTILAKAFHGIYGFPIAQLELPYMFGPLVSSISSVKDKERSKLIYVNDAVAAILAALKVESGMQQFRARSQMSPSHDGFLENETIAWVHSKRDDHLGNANTPAKYLETYGIRRDSFPCASKCESTSCLPSVFEAIQNISIEATDECEYVLYFADFSKELEELEKPKSMEENATEICRIAFVSGKSRLVQREVSASLVENNSNATKPSLYTVNGKKKIDGWTLVYLPHDDEESMSRSDLALLRIDPSGMFASSVTRAMYVEAPAFMKATDSQLKDTFREMERERIKRRRRKERRPGTSIWHWVNIPRERERKAIFYAKEPKEGYMPESVADFAKNAETVIPVRQVHFYNESSQWIFSDAMRPKSDSAKMLYDSFPYQWITTSVFIHDLKMKYSQDFRCGWFKEYLYWGGTKDDEILSFAYLMGKRRLQGLYAPRLADDPSWIPLLDPSTGDDDPENDDNRLMNRQGLELFMRIAQKPRSS